jgi:hypothetical protein
MPNCEITGMAVLRKTEPRGIFGMDQLLVGGQLVLIFRATILAIGLERRRDE